LDARLAARARLSVDLAADRASRSMRWTDYTRPGIRSRKRDRPVDTEQLPDRDEGEPARTVAADDGGQGPGRVERRGMHQYDRPGTAGESVPDDGAHGHARPVERIHVPQDDMALPRRGRREPGA